MSGRIKDDAKLFARVERRILQKAKITLYTVFDYKESKPEYCALQITIVLILFTLAVQNKKGKFQVCHFKYNVNLLLIDTFLHCFCMT